LAKAVYSLSVVFIGQVDETNWNKTRLQQGFRTILNPVSHTQKELRRNALRRLTFLGATCVPTPMPGLIDDSLRIVAGVRQDETKLPGMKAQPAKLPGSAELRVQAHGAGRTQVEGSTGMMLAATGYGNYAKDAFDGLACRELPADDARLPANAAVGRQRKERHAIARSRRLHPLPRARRAGCQP